MSLSLNTVYNNYLTTYSPKSASKYDTHKKSELQKVYSSIVKLNKEAPWYLPTTGKETQQYALSLKENARQMHNTIAQLGGLEESGLFSQKSAYSTNPDIVSATYVGPQTGTSVSPQFEIQVDSLATPQENMGTFLNNDKIKLPPDTYSFDVAINDMNYEFQFTLNEGETTKGIQERLVRLINNADIGLNAKLAQSDSRYAIHLTSETSGQNGNQDLIFAITDDKTSKTQGTVSYFGLDHVSQRPADAHFKINGDERTSDSNHFTVGGLFEIELHSVNASAKPVQIGLKTDVESLTDNIMRLVGSYNEFLQTAGNYSESQSGSRKLIREITGIASVYHESMSAMGLHMEADGYLSVDEEVLRRCAMQAEDVAETFRYLKSFSGRLLKKSNDISLDPMEYVDKKIVAYKNPGRNFVSPYTPSAYSGMMFNRYY